MPAYNVSYSYKTEEWDDIVVNADNVEEAEDFARSEVLDSHPEISVKDLTIESVKEVR